MTASAATVIPSPLESALSDVDTTLAALLVVADEQYAAVAANDRDRIDKVSRQQEHLSIRLARAEARRMDALVGTPLSDASAMLPEPTAARIEAQRLAIAANVLELKRRHALTSDLLEESILIASQTLTFLQSLVTAPPPVYTARGLGSPTQSLLVDSRA
jgi:FlgN protein